MCLCITKSVPRQQIYWTRRSILGSGSMMINWMTADWLLSSALKIDENLEVRQTRTGQTDEWTNISIYWPPIGAKYVDISCLMLLYSYSHVPTDHRRNPRPSKSTGERVRQKAETLRQKNNGPSQKLEGGCPEVKRKGQGIQTEEDWVLGPGFYLAFCEHNSWAITAIAAVTRW